MNLQDIATRIEQVPLRNKRRVIAIAGAPASGKSTLAEVLAAKIDTAAVVPMDGFHLSNDVLQERGLLQVKGAPDTFDAAGFGQLVRRIAAAGGSVSYPTFDRSNDCVVPDGGQLPANVQTVLVEGNYLLLNQEPWVELQALWDFSVMLFEPLEVLRDRLCTRWQGYGLSPHDALARATLNDIPNAKLVIDQSSAADMTVAGLTLTK